MPTPLDKVKEILPKEKIYDPSEMGWEDPVKTNGFNEYHTQLLTLLPEIDQIYKEWFRQEMDKRVQNYVDNVKKSEIYVSNIPLGTLDDLLENILTQTNE